MKLGEYKAGDYSSESRPLSVQSCCQLMKIIAFGKWELLCWKLNDLWELPTMFVSQWYGVSSPCTHWVISSSFFYIIHWWNCLLIVKCLITIDCDIVSLILVELNAALLSAHSYRIIAYLFPNVYMHFVLWIITAFLCELNVGIYRYKLYNDN